MLKITNAVDSQNGVAKLNHGKILGSENLPPIYGPSIKPSPKAIATIPNLFVFSVSSLISAIAEKTVATLPPVNPATIRLTKRTARFP